jgi:hypothetical protein
MEAKKIRCEDCDGCCCDYDGCCEEKGKCPHHDEPEETMDIETMAWWDGMTRGCEKGHREREEG